MLSLQHPQHSIRSFVLRQGRLTRGQKNAINTLWPQYGIQASKQDLSQHVWLTENLPLHIDIGFGMGHSLLQMAQQNPHIRYIGIDVYTPGMGHLLRQLQQLNVTNVRVIHADVTQILPLCPRRCFAVAYILFPDPWPKNRQSKRRLVQAEFMRLLVSRMRPHGKIYMATDLGEYAKQMRLLASADVGLRNLAENGYLTLQSHRPISKYEIRAKRRGNRVWDVGFSVTD